MKNDKVIRLTLASFFVNLAFAVYNAFLGFSSHSWWFITLSVYYIILSVMRFAVLQVKGKAQQSSSEEKFAKNFTGIMFIFLSVCLVGTVILSIVKDRGTVFHEITMIAIALYTFTKITISIVNLIKAQKNSSPTIETLRNISFADATVSIFSLQRSMLVSFPGMVERDIKILNIFTGCTVCITVFLLGINLIGGKRINMAKSKIVAANEKIAESVTSAYKKVEDTVVGTYKKVEDAAVGTYTKIEDKFVEAYLTHDGETVEEAKKRLKNQNNK